MEQNKNRRQFLKVTGKVAAGSLLLPHMACNNAPAEEEQAEQTEETPAQNLTTFGIQLYTLRDIIPDDPKGVLKQLADFGYKQIESYDHDKLGIFWGMPHLDFKSYIDDLGLSMVASHVEIKEELDRKAAQAAEVGAKYLICPHIGAQETLDDWKRIVDRFNECGDICKKNGLRFAYHNHAYSFEALDGIIPQDYMMENVNPDTVDFELDMYWVVTAGVDPADYLKKYPNRIRLSHVKDRMIDATEREATCTLGTGMINYPEILQIAKDNGMEYFIVEQERYDGTTPIDCARDNAKYMSNLKLA